MAEFVFKVGKELVTITNWDDVVAMGEEFDHVIKFLPDVPPEPHTDEQHAEMALWNTRLHELMEKERARSN